MLVKLYLRSIKNVQDASGTNYFKNLVYGLPI